LRGNTRGINIYIKENYKIEFDSMINLKANCNNMSRGVEDSETRDKITQIVSNLIK